MKKFLVFVLILGLVLVGVFFKSQRSQKVPKIKEVLPKMEKASAKKVAMILAFRDFRDPEYFVPKEIFEKSGIEVKTVSTKEGIAVGAEGGEAKVDLLLENLKVEDFDAVLFVGGPKALEYLDNETSYRIANETVEKGKILGAICISPVILAKAGVLKGKKATVWTSLLDKSGAKILKENGAHYVEEDAVLDGKIVTANGPQAAEKFAKLVIEGLKNE